MKYLLNTTRFVFYISLAVVVLACAAKKDVRTAEEIQAVFDQHRPEMQEIFAGFVAARSDLGGRTTFEITVQPSGQVSGCTVQSSDVTEPKFGEALCTKILSLDFGRKNMEAVTITHWLDFYAP
jgi:periplasmic protein TonB